MLSSESHPDLNPHGSIDETLRRGEQLYRKLGEQLPNVAVLVFDPEMRVLVAVGEALTDHGVRERDVEGRMRASEQDLRLNSERLAQLAQHDDLTKVANRLLFRDRLEQALARAERAGTQAAVIFLDVDRFKTVNDTPGHPAGDRLLQEIAATLTSAVRAVDTVARLGGDEFAVLVEGLDSEAQATMAVRRIFPVDVLKIDRMFIDELPENEAIADSIISLAHNLGLRVIAEGVENQAQYEWLKRSGCDAAAGYLLCRPQPAEHLITWLAARRNGGW